METSYVCCAYGGQHLIPCVVVAVGACRERRHGSTCNDINAESGMCAYTQSHLQEDHKLRILTLKSTPENF